MKNDRHGHAAVLDDAQLDFLLAKAPGANHRCLWAIQRWTAARVGEALSLRWKDLEGQHVTFCKANTKTKETRQVPQCARLTKEIDAWRSEWANAQGRTPKPADFVFPSRMGLSAHMTRQAADLSLRKTCKKIGFGDFGISTHSWRRSLATNAVRRGAPVPHVKAVTGHKSYQSFLKYIDTDSNDMLAVIEG